MKLGRKLLALTAITGLMIAGTSCNTSSKQSLTSSLSAPATAATGDGAATVEGELAVSTGQEENIPQPQAQPRAVEKKEPPRQFVLASANFPNRSRPAGLPTMVGSNLLVRTTAYCHKEADSLPYGRLSAAGGTLQYGSTVRSAAADWSRFPLGTRFRIEGQPYEYVIDDYGSALVGTNTIDLYKPTLTAMNQWGARHVPIHIIEWGCFHKSHQILAPRKHVEGADHVRQMLHDIESRYVPSHSTAQLLPLRTGGSEA